MEIMNKNIWVVHHHADPPDGHWTYTFDLMKILADRGYSITIFSSSYSHYSRLDSRIKGSKKSVEKYYGNIRFVFVKTNWYLCNNWRRILNMFLYSMRTWRYANKMNETPGFIIAAWPPPFGSVTAWLLSKKKKAKFLFEVHDLWPTFLIERGIISENGIAARFLKYMEMHALKKSDAILGLWPRMNLYFKSQGIPEEKTTWLPMGVDFTKIAIPAPPEDKKEGGTFIAMYRGRFGHTNDVKTILESAQYLQDKKYTDIKFLLVGEGPERNTLEQYAQKLELSNVTFCNFLPREKILEDMARADLLIGSLPNLPHFEKYGMISTKLLEYLSANRPVVFASNDKNHIVTVAKAGIVVEPENPEALAQAIISVYNLSGEERKTMAANGVAWLRKKHDLKILADRLVVLLNSL